MAARDLAVEPLTASAFAPFGEVVDRASLPPPNRVNRNSARRFGDLARFEARPGSGHAAITLYRVQPLRLPFRVEVMERHLLSSQLFFPLTERPWLIVVAPAGDFSTGRLKAFLASPKQAVNYAPGTWHHYCMALQEQSDFLVLERGGGQPDCDEVRITQSRVIRREAVWKLM